MPVGPVDLLVLSFPSENADPGPGARSKSPSGEWLRQGKYAEEKFVRR